MTDVADVAGPTSGPTLSPKGERTRARLTELAIDRFGSRGFRRTSVSEVARAAGLTQAAVYAYFANKEELFQAAVDADAEALLDQATARVRETPIHSLVPAFIVHLFTALDDHPLARRVLAGQEPDVIARLVDLAALHRFSAQIAERIRTAQQAGEARTDVDPVVLAAGIESLVLGILFSTVQLGGLATRRHQDGVVAAFDALLRPPT